MGASIQQLLQQAQASLAALSSSAQTDSEVLLAHALGKNRSYLKTWPQREPSAEQAAHFLHLLHRRQQGEPVAYLTGSREFWSLELRVDRHTLIPRPETEILVEQALLRIPSTAAGHILDLGTGSGAIALALAQERPSCRLHAVDISAGALDIARHNAGQLQLTNIDFYQGSWYEPVDGRRFAMIVSNPPYIAGDDACIHQGDLRFEPPQALTDGADGMRDLRHISAHAAAHLQTGGWLLLEHGYNQGPQVRRLLTEQGFHDISQHPDLAGHIRVSAARHGNG